MDIDYPLLSIIIPIYNGAAFLPSVLESIEQQDYEPLEVIVVDDGSTDNTACVAAEYNVEYVYQDHRGVSGARNRGLTQVSADFLLFFDVDDLMPKGKLHRQVSYLLDHPYVDIVSGYTQVILTESADQQNIYTTPEIAPTPGMGAAVVRRRAFDVIGKFDESLRYVEDADWYMRAVDSQLGVVFLRDITLFYRQHNQNSTRRDAVKSGMEAAILQVIRKSMQRRRNPDGTLQQMPDWMSLVEKE